MIQENAIVTGMNGASYRIGSLIGVGGEGTVYAVQGTRLVAKIYKNSAPGQEDKLRYMVNHPVPRVVDQYGNPILNAAWPQDILYDSGRNFVGYVMPQIENGIEIFEVERGCTSPQVKAKFPNYTWHLNVLAARNLATSVNILHGEGYVIGDMNCKNFLVNPNGSICLLDTDSIDMTDPATGIHYKCCVGMEDYLPPELQGRNLRAETARFTRESDNFALAVHIFQLLMNNYHPFSAKQTVVRGSSSSNPKMDRIVQGKCPYLNTYPDLTIPVGAPRLEDILPDYIIQSFRNTFDYTSANAMAKAQNRTTAVQWQDVLCRLLQECDSPNGLIRCQLDLTHFYLQSKGRCGLCAAKARYTASTGAPPVYIPQKPAPQQAQKSFFDSNIFYITEDEAKRGGNIAVYSQNKKEYHPLPQNMSLYPRLHIFNRRNDSHIFATKDNLRKCSDSLLKAELARSDYSYFTFFVDLFSKVLHQHLILLAITAVWVALDWAAETFLGLDIKKDFTLTQIYGLVLYLPPIDISVIFHPFQLQFLLRMPNGFREWLSFFFLWVFSVFEFWDEDEGYIKTRRAIRNEISRRRRM